MDRITGRVAITVMAEVDLGFRDLSDDEMAYVYRQAAGFRDWLVNNHGKTVEEAKEVCRELYDKDCALLQEVDPYADFIWSRGQEIGQAEIDLTLIANMDFELASDAEHEAHMSYWDDMEKTAEKYEDKKSPEQWKLSEAKFNEVMSFLQPLALQLKDRKLTTKDHVFLAKVNRKLNGYRFGKEPVLMFIHWAQCHNLLVEITGSGKVIPVKQPVLPEAEVDEDAMSHVTQGLETLENAGSTGDGEGDRET